MCANGVTKWGSDSVVFVSDISVREKAGSVCFFAGAFAILALPLAASHVFALLLPRWLAVVVWNGRMGVSGGAGQDVYDMFPA